MKKILSALLAVALILCFSAMAFADEITPEQMVYNYIVNTDKLEIASVDSITKEDSSKYPLLQSKELYRATLSDGTEKLYTYHMLFGVAPYTDMTSGLGKIDFELPGISLGDANVYIPPAGDSNNNDDSNGNDDSNVKGDNDSNDNKSNETNSDGKQQMINYTAKGTESFTVTLPIQYSSSKDTNGKVTMSGEFKIDVTDLAGDGQQYVNLKLTDASHKDRYFISDDNTRYDAQDANNSLTEVIDCYLQNEDVATAKIQYAMQKRISDTETSAFNVGDYVICKSVNTMAADYGPFSVTETLEFLLDPNGLTPITDIAHGTYSDLLTFESSVTSADPQA